MKKSKDNKVEFHEDTHSYILEGKKLTSVTKYISEFKAPFDTERIAGDYARKRALTKEYVIKMWKDKAEKSCKIGTYIHSVFEDYILNVYHKSKDYPKKESAYSVIDDLFKSGRLTPVEAEYIVYNEKYAGQIDCIAKNKKGEHFILDWKTNNKIDFFNNWQKMLGKYSCFDDCSFNNYSIQLNAYRELCKDYDIKACYIVHITDNGYKFIKVKDLNINLN
tara:strand:+ start:2478 stop:3140 length:663 start_codon:yes stop_codon:yes gene_type:complete